MNTKKPLQIFKPGTHTAMSGVALAFSETDLAATARAYDPAKHEAPLVCGHPRHDAPAYGWVKSLSFADGLNAEPQQVDPAFAEMVSAGKFKKISASFYAPDSPSNPVPGVYYLRHVGFLGAQPPAVKGLRNPEFAASESGIVEFSEWADMQNASLWRRLREWMIGEKGLDVADNIIPDYSVASLEEEARKPAAEVNPAPAFIESQPHKDSPMTPEEKARMDALEAESAQLKTENLKLKTEMTAFAEADKKRQADATHAGNVAFCEALVEAGRMLPGHVAVEVATLDFMASQGAAVEFGEGDAKKSLLAERQAMLKAQPVIVNFGESAGGKGAQALDPGNAEALAAKAVEFVEAEARLGRTVSVTAAVAHITKKTV